MRKWRLIPEFRTKEGLTLNDLIKEKAYAESLAFIETELVIIENRIKELKEALEEIKKGLAK